MNYFFGIKTENIYSNITIPRFNNDGNTNKEYLLCKANIKNATWNIEVLNNNKINDDFYLIEENISNNENIFFLAKQDEIDNFNKKKLINFNNFTDTSPAYRSNLKINLKNGGFSSYQSEYPFSMINRRGSILSSISALLNIEAEENKVFIKNIYEEPIHQKFNLFFVDIKEKKILEKFEMKTNYTNMIDVKKEIIKPEIFLITDNFIGAPLFVSIKDKHLSFEHTHPPHEYIMSQDKYQKIAELKKEISEIIN